ncbi:hypothetical protein BKA61DRAFT_164201 [Leptodontidium sp. MPI-SDFR-AT-0119]|nr:hypothetical protein BKA61DRAFT_164201 [Leptodontidium sp. MPI-SDFR-AT-0119]
MNYFFKLGAELKTFMRSIWTINFKTYNAVVDLQTRIPREFKPCWIQEPLILTDALGRVAPIHLELINSWDVFESVLIARFNHLPGHRKIARREYAIQEASRKLDIDRSQPYESAFLPGCSLDMSMCFKTFDDNKENSCPSCRKVSHENFDLEIKCLKCGMWYQRITDVDVPASEENERDSGDPLPATIRDNANQASSSPSPQRPRSTQSHLKRKRSETIPDDDDIRVFRRVRLLFSSQIDHMYALNPRIAIISHATDVDEMSSAPHQGPSASISDSPSLVNLYQEKHEAFQALVNQLEDPTRADNMDLLRSTYDCIKEMARTTQRITAVG